MPNPVTRCMGHESQAARARATQRMFDAIAPTYDFLNHLFSLQLDRWWRRSAVSALRLPASARIVDVCTGTADLALAAARRFPDCAVYGVDGSLPMLRQGHAKTQRQQARVTVTVVGGDAVALPFPDELFEAAMMGFGLRNLVDRVAGLREMHRVLKPGGQALILEFAPPPRTLVGWLFRAYLDRVMPAIGGWVSGSPSAYRYLSRSIAQFPAPDEIAALLQEAGFCNGSYRKLPGGMVYCYCGSKGLMSRIGV